jgi:predicted O-methyltransferase YrrM
MTESSISPLRDPAVHAVIERVRGAGRLGGGGTGRVAGQGRPSAGGHNGRPARDPFQFADRAFPVDAEQGDLMYLLCRASGATRVAEFATSLGVSTLYLTAAVRDNGGGVVIGSEIVPAKAEAARANLAEVNLDGYADIRVGDVLETFADLGGPIDFLLVDGWPIAREPSLARSVIEMVAPQLRRGAIVFNDNAETDYLSYVRDPSNGFLGMSLPLKGGTEMSVRI